MIYTHEQGLEKISFLKKKSELEIECLCLNASFMSAGDLSIALNKYKQLAKDFNQIVVLKESEHHEDSLPYYEMSLFCDRKELDKFELVLTDRGIMIDLIHLDE
jgi:hypothetical protein